MTPEAPYDNPYFVLGAILSNVDSVDRGYQTAQVAVDRIRDLLVKAGQFELLQRARLTDSAATNVTPPESNISAPPADRGADAPHSDV